MIIFILCVLASFTVARAAVWTIENWFIIKDLLSLRPFKLPKEFK